MSEVWPRRVVHRDVVPRLERLAARPWTAVQPPASRLRELDAKMLTEGRDLEFHVLAVVRQRDHPQGVRRIHALCGGIRGDTEGVIDLPIQPAWDAPLRLAVRAIPEVAHAVRHTHVPTAALAV